MQVTRRWWATVGLAGFIGVAAVVLAHPLLVAGAAGLTGWLLTQQWLFARTVHQLHDGLHITQSVARSRVTVDEAVTGQLTVERTAQSRSSVTVAVEAGIPLGASEPTPSARRCTLASEERDATTTFTVQWPVAGQATFGPPTVTVTAAHGLFETTFTSAAETPTVTVRPQHPHDLHVGAGGETTTAVEGVHAGDQQASGIEPETVREYAPGDPLRQIDWKATARSDTLYVRTFTDRIEHEFALFMDHRASMATGTPGATKLAYARQVALAVIDQAETDGDPVGLYAVGDGGVTVREPPGNTDRYATLRTALHDLTPTHAPETAGAPAASPDAAAGTPTSSTAGATQVEPGTATGVTPSDARRTADALATDSSPFATHLHPFFAARQTYVQRIATQPLYSTVRAYLTTGGETHQTLSPDRTVILTDDANPAEVREAVNVARRYSDRVVVFLTPTVLFEPTGLTDVDSAYDRYTDFEAFRQDLARLPQVSAFEVAPGDRIATLQSAPPATTPGGE